MDSESEHVTPKIHRLEKEVINRIAAGEVIQRPENAVKELVDSITITCKDGGLKLLQIKDNGHGIRKEDMPIVCERFTTSKLRAFEDLKSIATYGFRGEALASISHIAHISILSMTADAPCAYKASFRDGKMIEPQASPTAGLKGTTITIEDLFFNVPSRLKVLQKPSEEYVRVINLVTKYALHNYSANFTLIRKGESVADVRSVKASDQLETIKNLFGAETSKECLFFEKSVSLTDESALLAASQHGNLSQLGSIKVRAEDNHCKIRGYVTKPSFAAKKGQFILFINNRLVDCKPLKTVIDKLFGDLTSLKGGKPFVYLAIMLPPQIVDVNVHPTKSEVRFLHQEFIIEQIRELLFDKLRETNAERTFLTQSLLTSRKEREKDEDDEPLKGPKVISPALKIRTDNKEQTLNAFYTQKPSNTSESPNLQRLPNKEKEPPKDFFIYAADKPTKKADEDAHLRPSKRQRVDSDSDELSKKPSNIPLALLSTSKKKSYKHDEDSDPMEVSEEDGHGHGHSHHHHHHHGDEDDEGLAMDEKDEGDSMDVEATPPPTSTLYPPFPFPVAPHRRTPVSSGRKKQRSRPQLASIEQLLSQCEADSHSHLKRIFHEHTFVGCVDHYRVLLQHATDLYLCNLHELSAPFLFQEILQNFGEFDVIRLNPKPKVSELYELGYRIRAGKGLAENIAVDLSVLDPILEQREMLLDYFRIGIDEEGRLTSLPQILTDILPNILLLPEFIYNLAGNVDWTAELPCLEGISKHLANLFTLPKIPPSQLKQVSESWDASFQLEHVLLAGMKARFDPPQSFATNGSVVRIASLDKLYKVFERC